MKQLISLNVANGSEMYYTSTLHTLLHSDEKQSS